MRTFSYSFSKGQNDRRQLRSIVGVFNSEGPPVPIPNTEVKLVCAHNTWLEAAREDRSMPTQRNPYQMVRIFVFLLPGAFSLGELFLFVFDDVVKVAIQNKAQLVQRLRGDGLPVLHPVQGVGRDPLLEDQVVFRDIFPQQRAVERIVTDQCRHSQRGFSHYNILNPLTMLNILSIMVLHSRKSFPTGEITADFVCTVKKL